MRSDIHLDPRPAFKLILVGTNLSVGTTGDQLSGFFENKALYTGMTSNFAVKIIKKEVKRESDIESQE